MEGRNWCFLLLGLLALVQGQGDEQGDYMVGVGIADITGPAAELGMMGYASLSQSTSGIHTRLFARAFIVGSREAEQERVVFVSSDLGMVDQAIKTRVVELLEQKGLGGLYHSKNVLLSGTHTHSGPAGYIQYVLYGITSLGFNHQNFNTICNGIVESIEEAHNTLQEGYIYINHGIVTNASINRSPAAYAANPLEERNMYDDDIDKEMTLLKFVAANGDDLGSINWFAVHPTSMNNTNTLISGDNKGYAEMLFEYEMNPNDRPGTGKFVAAFAASNLGDVSPNTGGPLCRGGRDEGQPCDLLTSTCGGALNLKWAQLCIAFGPGDDMVESTEIIGRRQYEVASAIYKNATEKLTGPIQFNHQFVNMTNYELPILDPITGANKTTCPAALGYSFAAGTTDGPGAFDFNQGETTGNLFWDLVRDLLQEPTAHQVSCQKPKPILLDIGESHWPYEWAPSVVETQVLRIGNLFINAIPGELTIMAGRRLRNVVKEKATDNGVENAHVVIAGLSNVYTHYITTEEEYGVQRYEGASTIYGPNTLAAYLHQYTMLVDTMIKSEVIERGPPPPNLINRQISLVSPIMQDIAPLFFKFGEVRVQPDAEVFTSRQDKVTAIFVSGHLRNDVQREGTFLLVERQNDDDENKWDVVATDADWSTTFEWIKRSMPSTSDVRITWTLSNNVTPGFYRIRYFGYYKPSPLVDPRSIRGATRIFQVLQSPDSVRRSHPHWSPNPVQTRKITSISQLWNALFRRKNRAVN